MADQAVLFDYWRSSASYRVRIALHSAGIPFESINVDLLKGDQSSSNHVARNPQAYVPVLEIDGLRLTQSLAIIEYLDETRECGFLPSTPAERARVRGLAHVIAMDIHPVCNSNVVASVLELAGGNDEIRVAWMQKYIRRGLLAFETLLGDGQTGNFCHGDRPGLADFTLIPQLYNAVRWGADISDLQRIREIAINCEGIEAFGKAHPDKYNPE